jgi:hypothetical protein
MQRLGFCLLFLISSPLAAQCLQVTESSIEPTSTETSSAAVHWETNVKNQCKAEFDADLTVSFLDDDGGQIYEVRDLVTLGIGESRKVSKRVYVPTDTAARVRDISVKLEERKLPF